MKNILVVDDAMFMRTLLKNTLTRLGYSVVGEASNGKEGFEQYKALKPDLVTMDITMPEVNGIEGVKLIKGIDPSAKIIMVSAMGQKGMVVEAIQAGASGFIVKPFNAEKVGQEVGSLLKDA